MIGVALSITIGFALQVSGFGGPTARIIGWIAVGLVLLMVTILHFRRRGEPLPRLLKQTRDLGHEIRNFIHRRTSAAPPLAGQRTRWQPWRNRESPPIPTEKETYDAATVSLCDELFAERLAEIAADLRRQRYIGPAEVKNLIAPGTPTEIKELADWLIEIGCQT